eukprot:TRINITY_DN30707_c0_g1_i1.p1 TRINITY_DN30707_c0_g1~~TRINITY_DN30707_c0_g1_i1.p1  ORF type:complete len:318 (+),score=54.74 TRINITY_DN30707_c0_g1_i1:107-1060(+)
MELVKESVTSQIATTIRSVATPSPQSVYYLAYPIILSIGWVITWVNTKRIEAVKGDMSRVSEQLKEFYGPLASITAATHASYEAMVRQFLEQPKDGAAMVSPMDVNTSVIEGSDSAASSSSSSSSTTSGSRPIAGPPDGPAVSKPSPNSLKATRAEMRAKWEKQKKSWRGAKSTCAGDGQSPAAQHYRLWVTEVLQPFNERALEILIRRADLMDTTSVPVVFRQFEAHALCFRTLLARWKTGDFTQVSCAVKYPEGLAAYVGEEYKRLKLRQAAQLNTLHTIERRSNVLMPWINSVSGVEMKTEDSLRPWEHRRSRL